MPCVSLKHRRIYRDLIRQKSLNVVQPINPPETLSSTSSATNNHNKSKQNQFPTLLTDGMVVRIHQPRYLVMSASTLTMSVSTKLPEDATIEITPDATQPKTSESAQPKIKKSKTKKSETKKPQIKATQIKAGLQKLKPKVRSEKHKTKVKPEKRRRLTRADLINAESRLGSTIFGPVPVGHRREFFHDHDNIWIWHESWTDAKYRLRQTTIRYEVRPDGVYKKVSAGRYIRLTPDELANFRQATRTYLKLIKQHLYSRHS